MGGGSVADTIDESIRDVAAFDPEMFINSPLGQQALAETDGDYPRAVELAANRAKGAARCSPERLQPVCLEGENVFRLAGPARRTVSALQPVSLPVARREGLEETRNSQEQIAGNLAIGQIDGRSPFEGVDQAAVMGGIAGAGMAPPWVADVLLSNARGGRGRPARSGPPIDGPVMPRRASNRGPAEGRRKPARVDGS